MSDHGVNLGEDFSDRFEILGRMDFFNHAGVAPISGPAAGALAEYAREAQGQAYVGSSWYREAGRARAAAARLIGANAPGEIAFVANTTSGLAQVANGLPWVEGDQVVITDVEYPANRYPWEHLARTRGVELIEVAQGPDGRVDVADVIDAITDRTKVVSISHVQYASGFRIDLRAIADVVHQVPGGAYLCVDAIQSVGVLPVDVRAMGIDFLAADGHKWMLGPEGCGIFYCREDLAEMLTPTVVGWMCMVDATNYGDYRYALLPDARRFEPGSWNIPGIVALGASLELLLSVGIDTVWARVEALTGRLCAGLADKGYRVFSPRSVEAERSGIVIFEPGVVSGGAGSVARGEFSGVGGKLPGACQPTPVARGKLPGGVAKVLADLEKQHIVIVEREGRLRASPHFYNTPEQIDRLIAALPQGG